MPRIEVGLPQINLDAPRILAHCFLYELDEYLQSKVGKDFVRFMDDIDIGVDSVGDAKNILKSIDLVLQTRHVRLNSGKTLILKKSDAERHFLIRQNAFIDVLAERINRKVGSGVSVSRERLWIAKSIPKLRAKKLFDEGNGEKVLKRLLSMSARIGVDVDRKTLVDTLIRRPGSRSSVLSVIASLPLTRARTGVVRKFVGSGQIVDDASYVLVANHMVGSVAPERRAVDENLKSIREYIPIDRLFPLYSRIWLTSKYGAPPEMLDLLERTRRLWEADDWAARLVGGLHSMFARDPTEPSFRKLVNLSGSAAAHKVFDFHDELRRDAKKFDMTYNWLRAVNVSKRSGVSHPRLLLLASALANPAANSAKKSNLIKTHQLAWADAYHRMLIRRSAGIALPRSPISSYPVP